jgi:hypothetical protein
MKTETHTRCITGCFVAAPVVALGAECEILLRPGVPWRCGSILVALLLAFITLATMDTHDPTDDVMGGTNAQ